LAYRELSMMKNKTLEQVKSYIAKAQTCVINITADWCSDCIDQSHNLDAFNDALEKKQITCYTIAVQAQKNIYLSTEHREFTELLGGHGFPRTVLFIEGKMADADNVEIISSEQLTELSQQFLQQL